MDENADQDKPDDKVNRESDEELSDEELGEVAGGLSLNFGITKPTYVPNNP